MAYDVGSYRDWMVATLANGSVTLTEEQKKALAEELRNDPEKRGYTGDPKRDLPLLCLPYIAPNPDPQGVVSRLEWAPDELKNVLLQATVNDVPVWLAIKSLQSHENPQLAAVANLFPEVFSLKAISLSNPAVQAGIGAFQAAGIFTAEMVAQLTTMPDPNWQEFIEMPARADVVLGVGICPTLEEMA